MISKEFFKKNKFINGWAFTKQSELFKDSRPGDVIFIYNDNESPTGRNRKYIKGADEWYFYVKNNKNSIKALKEYHRGEIKTGKDWIRVHYLKTDYISRDDDLKSLLRSLHDADVETYEADLGPMTRLSLDYDIQIEDWNKIRVLYFDIETDDTNEGIEVGRDRILSFAGIDRDGKEYYLTDKNEKVLLEKIQALVLKFDMLVGWNSKDFDIPYLIKRGYKYKMDPVYYYQVLHEDMMRRLQYFYSKDPEARQNISSYSLDYISNYFLGEGKIKHKESIKELFDKHPQRLKNYNLRDCELLKRLEEKLGLIEVTYMLFQTCQVFARDWSTVKTIDIFMLSEANKKGIHYRTNRNKIFREDGDYDTWVEYLGALVLDPNPGYYENVYDLDFKSLYPNIIRTFNISPDSVVAPHDANLDPDIKTLRTPQVEVDGKMHGGMYFNKGEWGIIPNKINVLLEERAKVRKKMKSVDKRTSEYKNLNVKQLVIKELANSIYGVFGNKWFRSFSTELAESITVTGQYFIKWLKTYLEKRGRKVLYGDTDSVFVILKGKEDIKDVLKETNEALTKHLKKDFNIDDSKIELELDVKFDQFLIEAKKKYVGKSKEGYKYIGMECVKRDTIPVAVNYQKKLIDRVFKKQSALQLQGWIKEKQEIILKEKFETKDITIRKRINKALDSYKGKDDSRTYTPPVHVRVARELAKKKGKGDKTTEYSAGSIMQYIITDGIGGKINEAIHVSEYKGKWDRKYYWNNVVYPLLQRILEVRWPEMDWEQYKIEHKKPKKPKQEKLL